MKRRATKLSGRWRVGGFRKGGLVSAPHLIRAFTLLELLVSVAITLLLTGILLTVSTGTLGLVRRSQGKLSANAQAKMVLDVLERDLQAAVCRPTAGSWLAVDVLSNPADLDHHGWLTSGLRLKPSGAASMRLLADVTAPTARVITAARFGLSGTWLRFVTTNVETAGSLPAAVAYQIVRRPVTGSVSSSNPAGVRYTLCRASVSTEQTFVAGYDVGAPAFASNSANPAATRSPATLTNPNNADALANNVVDLGVWLYARNPDGSLRRIFPEDEADTAHAGTGGSNPPDASRFPEVADVMVRILTEEGAALVENMETGRTDRPPLYATDAEWWWGVVEANSQVFARRITVQGSRP